MPAGSDEIRTRPVRPPSLRCRTLAEDLGDRGDITSAAVIPVDVRFAGATRSREALGSPGCRSPMLFSERSTRKWSSSTSRPTGIQPKRETSCCTCIDGRAPSWRRKGRRPTFGRKCPWTPACAGMTPAGTGGPYPERGNGRPHPERGNGRLHLRVTPAKAGAHERKRLRRGEANVASPSSGRVRGSRLPPG